MVLQAAPYKARIWGYAPEGSNGSSVVVRVGDDIKVPTLVEDDLTWNVAIGKCFFLQDLYKTYRISPNKNAGALSKTPRGRFYFIPKKYFVFLF